MIYYKKSIKRCLGFPNTLSINQSNGPGRNKAPNATESYNRSVSFFNCILMSRNELFSFLENKKDFWFRPGLTPG